MSDKLDEKLGKVAHGFIAPQIEPDHYVLGVNSKLPKNVIQANKDWTEFRTGDERQSKNFDTYGCTVYNTLKSISKLEKRLYGSTQNYSERFIYTLAGVKPPGDDPHRICEAIREYGLIPEEMLPFDDTITSLAQYADPKAITQEMLDEGLKWKAKNEFLHEWVFNSQIHDTDEKIRRIRETLQYSPLGGSVDGWNERNGMYWKDKGARDNHWTEISGTVPGYNHVIDDSYNPFIKKLQEDYDFGFVKRYHLRRRSPEEQLEIFNQKKTLSNSLLADFKRLLDIVGLLKAWPFYKLWKEGKPFNPEKTMETPIEPIIETPVDKLNEWALAIQEFEGYKPGSKSYINKNPGNCKARNGTFLKFATYEDGFNYLKDYLRRAQKGQHNAYKPTFTLKQFVSVYAPDGEKVINNYTNYVAKKLCISPDTLIKDIV